MRQQGANHATFIWQRQEYMLEMFIKYAHLLSGVVRDDNEMMLRSLYVRYMGLEKRMSEVLMVPGIGFGESET